jgi:sterol desaturase/sphingolipid hydroxylase (fatty acid hydroxylase superfamily)
MFLCFNLYRMLDPILIVSIILGYDIWFYISHLILHMPWFFKNIHKEHHALIPKKMTFTDAYVGHWSEGIFQGLGVCAPFFLFQYDLYDSTTIASAGVAIILINLRGMARHDVNSIWLIGNHHLLHHVHPNANYGEYWLDWLFGTMLTESKHKEEYVKGMVYW